MKENDGRAARRKYTQYGLLFVVVGLFGIMVLISLTSSSSSSSDRSIDEYDKKRRAIRKRHGLLNHIRHAEDTKYVNKARRQEQEQQDKDATDENDDSLLQGILEGHLHLVNVRPMSGRGRRGMRDTQNGGRGEQESSSSSSSSYRGLFTAYFCHLDWNLHKTDPSTTPMFRWLVDKSPDCSNHDEYEVDLYDIVQKVKQFDNTQFPNKKIKLLNLAGVVFHESRCGSTLVANMLAAMNPTKHRVYSESPPPIVILRTTEVDGGHLSVLRAADILKDVIYLMRRSNDFQEERVFFKIQSIGTRSLSVFQQAFPNTPWIFVYRDPVQVMMSHLGKGNPHQANCVRPQSYPADAVERIVTKYSSQQARARDLSYQDFCAAHLASLTETALEHMLNSSENYSIPVNYATLPDIMWTDILPNHWHVPTGPDEIQRMQLTATQYSKQGTGDNRNGGVEFTGDSQKKDKAASPAIRMAALRYLQPSFDALEKVAAARGVKMH